MKVLRQILTPLAFLLTLGFFTNCSPSSDESDRENLLLATLLTTSANQGMVISADGTPIYYRSIGSGTPVVVLHGGPGLDHNYLVKPLTQTIGSGKRLIFFDQRGTGFSGGAVGPSNLSSDFINVPRFLEDLEAIRVQLGLGDKINILGHSWGGLYAMLYATDNKYKDKVKSLALVGSAGANGGYYGEFFTNIVIRAGGDPSELFVKQGNLLNNPSLANLKTYYQFLFKFYFADYTNPGSADGRSENLTQLNLRNSTDKTILNGLQIGGLINFQLGIAKENGDPTFVNNVLADVSKITAPTLLVHGDTDVLPIEFVIGTGTNSVENNIGTPLDRLRTRTITDSGHFPFIEQPTRFTEAFQGFYDNL